jgi:O-antigen/teichoic acid export membrane protein
MPGLVLAAQCSLVALACLAMAVVGIVLGAPMAAAGAGLVALGALHGFTQQVFLVASAESRSRGDALRYAWQNMTRSVLASVLGIGAALYTGSAAWILAVEVLAAAMQSASMFHRSVRRASAALGEVFRLAVRQLPGIDWRAALTMMLVAALSFLMINADRWVAADRLDVHGFGLYSFAWIVLLVAQGVQAVLNASIFPLLARTRGSGGGRAVFAICCRWSALLLGAGLLAALGAWWLLDMAISRWFLPYQQAQAVVPVLLLVAVLRVSDFWSSYLLVVGREGSLLVVNALAALASIGTWCLLVRPWAGALTLQQVSWLAAAFAVIGYVAVAGAAWRARSA